MIKGKKIIGVIPARGGSKGVPKKNIKNINGKPLIAWTIEAAHASKYLDEVIVSTDSEEIKEVAEQYGAKVPFMRPPELAQDTSTSMDVLFHSLQFMKESEGLDFDILMMLEPTSPLREVRDIDDSLEMLVSHGEARSIAGISYLEGGNPDFVVTLNEGLMRSKNDFVVKRRQDIDDYYFYEGTIYASYVDDLLERKSFYHELALGYVVPKWKSFEIDDMVDFSLIEHLLKEREKGVLE